MTHSSQETIQDSILGLASPLTSQRLSEKQELTAEEAVTFQETINYDSKSRNLPGNKNLLQTDIKNRTTTNLITIPNSVNSEQLKYFKRTSESIELSD